MIAHLYEAPDWGTGALLVTGGAVVDHEEPRPDYRPPAPEGRAAVAEELAERLKSHYGGAAVDFADLDIGPALRWHGMEPSDASIVAAIRAIPRGETRSYAAIAREAGRERAWRAVGGVCARGPLAVIVPYHRVINADGGIGGYGELGGERKRRLLALEGACAR